MAAGAGPGAGAGAGAGLVVRGTARSITFSHLPQLAMFKLSLTPRGSTSAPHEGQVLLMKAFALHSQISRG